MGEQLWRIAALITVTAGLLTAVGLFRRFGDMAGMLMVALTSLLASPISWGHYWIWIVPAITWGCYEAWRLRAGAGAVSLIVVVALFLAYPARIDPVTGRWDGRFELVPKGVLWSVPQAGEREYDWGFGQQVLGNVYVLFGVVVFVAAVGWLGWVYRRSAKRLVPASFRRA